jgi:ATP-dependent RNA helicase SUPV3L1/SUV3
MSRVDSSPPPGAGTRIWAVLGPTNTGKTHLAVERMLGHATGIIGLPLRLLAREIYDRVAAAKGPRRVALVTGEEKIVPPNPQWFVCTVEAMPLDRSFDFVAIDEIQLIGDAERGHVFTDRLLHARGASETMFLGAETARNLIRRLVPEAAFDTRPRFSKLTYSGGKKLSRLPRRSAIVAFSADEVYGIAEQVRRQRGGAAVVMGALSPRTRNAQVAIYQSGEVDFLVATDAIGMGINMDVDHVAFAAIRKFDGVGPRPLKPGELGQIAGRAGRHMNDGTFGTTGDVEGLDADVVEKIENHRFDPVSHARWRSSALEYRSVPELLRSLDAPPPLDCLVRAREAEDQATLRTLSQDREAMDLVRHRDHVRLLWQVCQIPDFRKTMHDQHVRLLRQIWLHLAKSGRVLPPDWVAQQIARLDIVDGDIDALATRLAHVRTWTFIAHRGDWLDDPAHWQGRARAIEDRLSDALHERLTQRFVDRRAAALVRGLDGESVDAVVLNDGGVLVAGAPIGRLEGLTFVPDRAGGVDIRMLRTAANRTLGQAVASRAAELAEDADKAFSFGDDGALRWRDAAVARLTPGADALHPRLVLVGGEVLDGQMRERVLRRLEAWLRGEIGRRLAPLVALQEAPLAGLARGLAYQLAEGLGVLPRAAVTDQVRALKPDERHALRRAGVRIGEFCLYLPAVLKPDAVALKGLLWSLRNNRPILPPPRPGLTSFVAPQGRDEAWWLAAGFVLCGPRAVRLDMLERVALAARKAAEAAPKGLFAPPTEIVSLLGCGMEDLPPVMKVLGYGPHTDADGVKYRRRRKPPAPRAVEPEKPVDETSPFAQLRRLKTG